MSSKNGLEPAPTPETGRNKGKSRAELLRAMCGLAEVYKIAIAYYIVVHYSLHNIFCR
jgi:hypothetical protein